MANIKKVEICVGGKTIGTIDVPKPGPLNEERMLLLAILANEPLVYTKGETASLRLGKNYSKEFKVKKSFAVHGRSKDDQLFVTIPATIDTLRGSVLSARRNEYNAS